MLLFCLEQSVYSGFTLHVAQGFVSHEVSGPKGRPEKHCTLHYHMKALLVYLFSADQSFQGISNFCWDFRF